MDDAHDSRPSPQKRVETCLFLLFIYLLNTVCSNVQTESFVLGVKQFTNCLKPNLVWVLPATVDNFWDTAPSIDRYYRNICLLSFSSWILQSADVVVAVFSPTNVNWIISLLFNLKFGSTLLNRKESSIFCQFLYGRISFDLF